MSVEKEITQQESSGSIYSKIYNFFLLEDLQKDAVKSKQLYLISTKDLTKFHDCIKYPSLKELKANKEKEFNQKSIEDYYKENNIDLKPLDGDTKIKIIEKTEEKEGMENLEVISEIVVEILQSIGYEIEIIKKEEQNKQDETKDNKNEPNNEIPQEQAKSEAKDVNRTEEQIKQEKGEEKNEQEKKDEEIKKEEEPKKDEVKGDKTNKEEEKEKEKINEKKEGVPKKEGEDNINKEKGDKENKIEEKKLNKEKEKEEAKKVEEDKQEENKKEDNKLTDEKEPKKPEEQINNPPKEEIKNIEANNEKKQEEVIKPNEDNQPIEDKKEEEKKEVQADIAQNIPQETNPIQNDKVESPTNENNDPPKQENGLSKEEKKDEDKKEPPKSEEKEQITEKVENKDNSDSKQEQPNETDALNIDENKDENKGKLDETGDNKECIKIKKIIDEEQDNKDKILLNKKVNRGEDNEKNEQEISIKKNKIEEQPNQEEKNEIKESEEIKEEKNEIKDPEEIPKEQNEFKNPQENQGQNGINGNVNVNSNQLTQEQMLFIQMQQQMMIQKYFMDNGWENNFINNYLLNIPVNSEDLDDGLPHAKNGIIQLDSDKPSLGLQNVGATCYMNATLECLIHMKELSQLLLSAFFFKYPKENKDYAEKHKLTLNYINILSQVFFPKLNGNQSKYYAPYEFKNIISELNPLFQGVQANDAKDLLQCILENLHTELKMATQYFQEYNIDQRDEKASMQYFFNSYITQNKSPIQDYLYGINRIKSICLKCNTAKYNFQTYNLLYFPLKEAKRVAVLRKKKEDEKFDEKNYTLNLEDCFAHSEQVDHFTGDNQMFCNECQSSADAEYQTVLYTTPTILSIVLNRGKANLDFQENFEFGLDLDIKKYIYNPEAKHGKYYLIGMVVHSGLHGMGGHFIAYCRMDKKAKWFCYNDAWVTECNDIEKKLSENSPYILFYHYDTDYNNENKENKEAQK